VPDKLTSAVVPCLRRGSLNLNLMELDNVVDGELRRPMPAVLMRDRIIAAVKGEERTQAFRLRCLCIVVNNLPDFTCKIYMTAGEPLVGELNLAKYSISPQESLTTEPSIASSQFLITEHNIPPCLASCLSAQ